MDGSLEKVCPHTSTGRADYFGSTVNRAARLLCAAKPGQILAEAPVMEAVLREWRGPEVLTKPLLTRGSVLLESGAFTLPALDSSRNPSEPSQAKVARNRTAPNLLVRVDSSTDRGTTAETEQGDNSAATAKTTVELEANSGRNSLLQPASLSPRVAARNWARPSKQGVHFAAASMQVGTVLYSCKLCQEACTEIS